MRIVMGMLLGLDVGAVAGMAVRGQHAEGSALAMLLGVAGAVAGGLLGVAFEAARQPRLALAVCSPPAAER